MPYSHPQTGIDRATAIKNVSHLLPGAMTFAAMAGYINAVAIGFFHTPVAHMSGAISHFGVDVAENRTGDALASFSIIVGFLCGAMLSGAMIGAYKLTPGRRYSITLCIESGLLIIGSILVVSGHRLGLPLLATACGLQNAMTSGYCGLVIRTTHVTGTVTDIGVMLGHWLRHRRIEIWKLSFLSAVTGAFFLGGTIGAWLDLEYGPVCLLLAAAACLIAAAIVWLGVRQGWLHPQPAQ